MLLTPTSAPYADMAYLCSDTVAIVSGDYMHRPDELCGQVYPESGVQVEMFCNWASCRSPIHLLPGDEYLLPVTQTVDKFLGV